MVELIAYSENAVTRKRLATFKIEIWKPILGELARHRVFSLSAASSRAIPVHKIIQQVKENPFIPDWTINQKGMTGLPVINEYTILQATNYWLMARSQCISISQWLADIGIHKQQVNRLLEPFMVIPVLVSGTEWENFFALRCSDDAQPELRKIAQQMRDLYYNVQPDVVPAKGWHLPMQLNDVPDLKTQLQICVARAARVSYQNFEGNFSIEKDKALAERLWQDKHLSPFEHCAIALDRPEASGNFRGGWIQLRELMEFAGGWDALETAHLAKA